MEIPNAPETSTRARIPKRSGVPGRYPVRGCFPSLQAVSWNVPRGQRKEQYTLPAKSALTANTAAAAHQRKAAGTACIPGKRGEPVPPARYRKKSRKRKKTTSERTYLAFPAVHFFFPGNFLSEGNALNPQGLQVHGPDTHGGGRPYIGHAGGVGTEDPGGCSIRGYNIR